MLKKEQYIEQLRHRLCGGDPTTDTMGRFHPLIVEKEVDAVYESLLQSLFSQNIKGGNYSVLDAYTRTFPSKQYPTAVPVLYDTYRDEYYSELPKPVIVLNSPGDGSGNYGIRLISLTKGQANAFIPIDNNASTVFSGLEVNTVNAIPTYYVEENKVYYNFTGLNVPEEVLMKIVPTFSFLADDDFVTMPEVMTKNGMLTVGDLVFERFMGEQPEKMTNDNNSNT